MIPETVYIIGSIVFAAGIVYAKVGQLENRVTRLETWVIKLLQSHLNKGASDNDA